MLDIGVFSKACGANPTRTAIGTEPKIVIDRFTVDVAKRNETSFSRVGANGTDGSRERFRNTLAGSHAPAAEADAVFGVRALVEFGFSKNERFHEAVFFFCLSKKEKTVTACALRVDFIPRRRNRFRGLDVNILITATGDARFVS